MTITARAYAVGAAPVRELWAELSATMRSLRQDAGLSLRQVEAECRVGRGTLSQFETGKARPNRVAVEWYDTALGADGMLLTLYAEARGAHGPLRVSDTVRVHADDAMAVVDRTPPLGELIGCGTTVDVTWTLANTGTVPWRGRRIVRLGARGGIRLLASEGSEPVPACDPGDRVDCRARLTVPAVAATYVAHWQLTDPADGTALPIDTSLSVTLVARHL